MMTQSNAYWKRRAARNEARSGERSLSLIAELLRQYELAKVKLRREVNDFYARYADEDGISYADAVKRLNNAELTEWRYELGKYVEDINAETDPEVKRRLISELNARSYGSRITRLTALEGQINTVTASLFSEGVAKAKATFGEAFTEGYFRTSYDLQCRSGFAREIAGIDEKLIEEVLSYRYDGQDFSSRIWKNKTALALNLKNTLTDSLIRGKSAAETAAALSKQTDASFRSAARLVRTEMNRFHNEGAMRAYSEAGIEYYEFIATYDARTCDECAALDGKRFRLDEKEPGVNFPPIHPNDRCTTVAYDPDWDDGKAVEKLCGGYEEWKKKVGKKALTNGENGDIIKVPEMFRKKGALTDTNRKAVSEETFRRMTIGVKKAGATVVRCKQGDEWFKHLERNNATASCIGDVLVFRSDATVSEILEETHHFIQNVNGLNSDKESKLRTILNEIDAKTFILNNARKYSVPRSEIETVREELKKYTDELIKYYEGVF